MSMQSNYPRPNLIPDGFQCPSCGLVTGKKINYTWWGGAVGPAVMNLTKCQSCGYLYNRKTGKPAKKAIIMYNVIVGILAVIAILFSILARQ